jgi:hypothetical protein
MRHRRLLLEGRRPRTWFNGQIIHERPCPRGAMATGFGYNVAAVMLSNPEKQ